MAISTQTLTFAGEAGDIDCALDLPEGPVRGWALLLHPHSLQGGSRDNKVVTTLGRACLQAGLAVLRPNMRGVGASAGAFDHGQGETRDLLGLLDQVEQRDPDWARGVWVIGGFSFGSSVAAQVLAQRAAARGESVAQGVMLVGSAVARFATEPVTVPASTTLVVHGEQDDVVPLGEALDWARPQSLPVAVIPGAGHFFHGKLLVLRQLASDYLKVRLA